VGDEVKEAATGVEAAAEAAPGPATEARQIYNPHIELADGMKQRLRDCTELAGSKAGVKPSATKKGRNYGRRRETPFPYV
jgi:hypothetical protein